MKPFYQDSHVTIFHGDCRDVLPQIDAGSVQCCVTSPPYFGLRDYGGHAQIGLESTPAAYVAEMTSVFSLVSQAMRDDATLWLNLGDSYCGGGGFSPDAPSNATSRAGQRGASVYGVGLGVKPQGTLKTKDLIGIPWRVAFALQDAGWWLRSDIIWAKGNPMPESVTDRPTKAHEYLFLLAKAERYYYDADAIAERSVSDHGSGNGYKRPQQLSREGRGSDVPYTPQVSRNRRTVWTVNTQPYAGAHFAVFPEKLIEPCILAGCPEGGIVIDPFGGSGTTARVAKRLGRKAILIEQNEAYCEMAAASLAQNVFDLVLP